jgi:hypothetical protein
MSYRDSNSWHLGRPARSQPLHRLRYHHLNLNNRIFRTGGQTAGFGITEICFTRLHSHIPDNGNLQSCEEHAPRVVHIQLPKRGDRSSLPGSGTFSMMQHVLSHGKSQDADTTKTRNKVAVGASITRLDFIWGDRNSRPATISLLWSSSTILLVRLLHGLCDSKNVQHAITDLHMHRHIQHLSLSCTVILTYCRGFRGLIIFKLEIEK